MSFEQKFDKLIKNKIEEAEFPFDESNWAKANKMLDAEKGASARKNTKVFLLAASLVLMLGTAGFFTFKYMENNHSSSVVTNNENSGNVNSDKVNNTDSKIVAGTNTNNGLDNSDNKNVNENNSAVSSAKENNSDNKKSQNSKSYGSINVSNNSEVGAISNSSAERKSNASNLASKETKENTSIIHNTVSTVDISSDNSTTSNDVLAKNNAPTVSKGKLDKYSKGITSNRISNRKTESSKPVNGQSKGGYINVNDQDQSTPVAYEETIHSSNESDYRVFAPIMKMSVLDVDSFSLKKTPYDFIRIYEDDYYKSVRRRKTHFINVEAGMAYMFGWNVPVGKDAKGFNTYAGANYGLHITKRLSASVGAQIYNIGNIEQPFYTGSNVTYGFGSNGTYTSVASNSLYYFSVPLKVSFTISKHDQIGASVNTGILFNGMNTIETYTMKDGIKSNEKKTRYSGYFEGTNTTNIMLSAFYTHSFTKRIKVNGEFMYGLSDTYKNSVSTDSKESNMGIRLGIQYTLFDR